jgi:hypothetical protein
LSPAADLGSRTGPNGDLFPPYLANSLYSQAESTRRRIFSFLGKGLGVWFEIDHATYRSGFTRVYDHKFMNFFGMPSHAGLSYVTVRRPVFGKPRCFGDEPEYRKKHVHSAVEK